VIYRDLKLENVLIQMSAEDLAKVKEGKQDILNCQFKVKLADFGISKDLARIDQFTDTVVGSSQTMGNEKITLYFSS
jgi:serine/threonine protein kinase